MNNEGITRVWQKWRFRAPQTHLWLIKVWFSVSTFVVKIATFAKPENVIGKLRTHNMKIIRRLKKLLLGDKNSVASSNLGINSPEIKELSIEELYPNMTDDEIWMAILEKDEDELTSEELGIKLGMTLHNEHLYGRSLAIRELLNNSYQILNDEYGNPFKELINFTLLYFERFNVEKPDEANKLLRSCFPLMHQFIYRHISKQQNTNVIENKFDEQKAYDEFLDFCKNVFISLYPEKDIRDGQIKRHFKISSNDLINFIENG